MVEIKCSDVFRIISFVVLFFFSWTFGGLFDVAYAVKYSGQQSALRSQPRQKGKTTAQKFNGILRDMERVLNDSELLACAKTDMLKDKESEIDELDSEVGKQFSETEKMLKEAGLSRKILKRHYAFVDQYEKNIKKLKSNLSAIGRARTKNELNKAITNAKTHLEEITPLKKHKPVDPDKLPHRTVEPVFKEPRTRPEEFKNSGKQLAVGGEQKRIIPANHSELDSGSLLSGSHSKYEIPKQVRNDSTVFSSSLASLNNYIDNEQILLASSGSTAGLLATEDNNSYLPISRWREPAYPADRVRSEGTTPDSELRTLNSELLLAATDPPTSEDLEETMEVQFTQAIIAKAAELQNDPLKMYEWVRNNVEFVPTYGSIQGADYCLQTMQCNAFDTASLLIALMRASNIHARYVEGTVEISIERVMNWLGGFTDKMEALNLLASAGIPVTGITEGGEIKYVRMEHIWMEAWIDYFPSRGARHRTGKGELWIPLDGSFKQYNYTQGIDIQSAVPFDAQSFIDQIQATATINEEEGYVTDVDSLYIDQTITDYQTQVEDYITQNYPDTTVGEVLGTKEIIPQNFPFLLGTLPYRMLVRGTTYSEMPDNMRHKITFEVKKDMFDETNGTPINITKSLPEVAGKKITLSYSPATPDDEEVINSYLPDPHEDGTPIDPSELPTSLAAYLINLKPELRIDGEVVATGTEVGMGATEEFKMTFTAPGTSADIISNDIEAGEYLGIGIDPGRISEEQMTAIKEKLEETKAVLETENFTGLTKDDILGDFLYTTAISYYAELDVMDYIQVRTMGLSAARLPSETIFSNELAIEKFLGVPLNVSAGGLAMDADRIMVLARALDADKDKQKQFMLSSGMNSSALEHAVPEQMFSTEDNPAEGISAVKALQIANDQGIPIYTINQTNIDLILPQLQTDGGTMQDIQNAVHAGKTVTVSKTDITYNGWTGVGYIIIDPLTGDGAYMISGGMSGAWLIIGSLSFIFVFLGIATVLSFMGPFGIFLAAALTLGLAVHFMNSIGEIIDALDSGEITPLMAERAIVAKAMSAVFSNLISWGIPYVLDESQAIIASLFETVLFNVIIDNGLLLLF